jgi:DNA-binding NtrC family response regulator
MNVLIVDDERAALRNLQYIMHKEGYNVACTQSGQRALELIRDREFDVVLTDLRMERVDGMDILRHCKSHCPHTEVIIITGYATLQSGIDAVKEGAFYYIPKPFKIDLVRKIVREAGEKVRLKRDNQVLREQIASRTGDSDIITQNDEMKRILKTAVQIGPTDCNVILHGESGTGKEMLARFIHRNSSRSTGAFVAVNCGSFSDELVASEFFGHEKGAFTGATTAKKGLIETAHGGTFLLDEITEMPLPIQVHLLRVIQEQEVLRLGATKPVRVDVRFIASTNRDLHDALREGRLRNDLFHRLNVVSLHLPPLSRRKDDIPVLCRHFLIKHSERMKKDVSEMSEDALEVLSAYDFPGNVRELENIIARAVAISSGAVLTAETLPQEIRRVGVTTFRTGDEKLPSLDEHEAAYVRWVLNEVGGNKVKAAKILGIDRVSLWRKLKRYGVE